MNKYDLSVVIVGCNEEFMSRTVDEVMEKKRGNTEVIVVCDEFLPNPPLKAYKEVTFVYNATPLGQRAATNMGAKLSQAKYIMKLDAHCALDEGFDVKMMKEMQDNYTMIPVMRNLHAFDWVCPDGHRRYQGPSGPCKECGKPTVKDVVWIAKTSPQSVGFRFDTDMHFQYWNDIGYKDQVLTETLSIQGSCFMLTREKYFELDICSEEFHGWGQQGVEVACKTWLSGGRVVVNHNTWYAHMFRTQGGDFSFPYSNPQSKVLENRELSKRLFRDDQWPQAIHKFQWLIDKFNPPGWESNGTRKGIIFYTDNQLDERYAKPVREQLLKIRKDKGIPIVTSSLRGLKFGDKNIRFPSLKRGYLTMFKQILGALENSNADIVYFCEHDVLYHPSHFDFTPKDKETFYYNENVWLLRVTDGHALHYDVKQLSGLCVYRQAAITHFKERIAMVEKDGYTNQMGFEPFTHGRIPWKNVFKVDSWMSDQPNVDIKHGSNLTGQRWKKEDYRNQQLLKNWMESDNGIPGWGKIDI